MVVRIALVHLGTLLKELEVLKDEARLLAMVVPGGVENDEGQGKARRCVPVEGKAAVPNEIVVPVEVLDAHQRGGT